MGSREGGWVAAGVSVEPGPELGPPPGSRHAWGWGTCSLGGTLVGSVLPTTAIIPWHYQHNGPRGLAYFIAWAGNGSTLTWSARRGTRP